MAPHRQGKVIIFSAPSGSGKSTIVNHLIKKYPQLEFSISATCRAPRGEEKHGKEYYFLSQEDFTKRVRNDEFIEWEEVYAGTSYGTLKSEIERIWNKGHIIVFAVDVKGGVNLKQIFGEHALSIFVMPPSIDELRHRLVKRGTDSAETIEKRVAKAAEELEYAPKFDRIIVNDELTVALAEAEDVVGKFIEK